MRYGRGYNQRGVYLTETVIVEKGEKIEPKTRDSCRKTCTLQKNAESPNLEGAKPPDGVETRNEDAARHATKWRRRMEARSGDAASHGETRQATSLHKVGTSATEWRRGTPQNGDAARHVSTQSRDKRPNYR